MVTADSEKLEELIHQIMQKVGVDRITAYRLAILRLEYDKHKHGRWQGDT